MITILIVVVAILSIIAYWFIFEKAGEDGWKSLIPFYNTYILFKISWGNGWLFFLELIPIANIVILIIMLVKLSHAFGYGGGFATGLVFLPNIFLLILAFDASRYVGPNGVPRIARQNYGGYGGDYYDPYGGGQQGPYTNNSNNPNDPYSGMY